MLRRIRLTVVSSLCLVAHANAALAGEAEACAGLLRHGLYDYMRDVSDVSNASVMRKEVTDAYRRMEADKKTAKGALSVYGLLGGSVNLTSEQLEIIYRLFASSDLAEASQKQVVDRFSASISREAVAAWESCVTQQTVGLLVRNDLPDDPLAPFALTIRYAKPIGAKDEKLEVGPVIVSPARSMTCRWVVDGKVQGAERTQAVSDNGNEVVVQCERNPWQSPVRVAGRRLYAPAASLSIRTSKGSITRNFAAVSSEPSEPVLALLKALQAQVQEHQSRLSQLEPRLAAAEGSLQELRARSSGARLFGLPKGPGGTCQEHCRSNNNGRGSCIKALGGASLDGSYECNFTGGPVLCLCASD